MEKDKYRVIIGGLLHDVGKPVQRRDRGVNHSKAGTEFLRSVGCNDPKITEQVLNGVAVRMALLFLLVKNRQGGEKNE